jgi:superfamily II RNA helicase
LKALANGLACWQNLRAPKTWKTGGVDPTDVRWIAQLLEPLIQAKFEISKEFTVAVYAVAAVTELSSSVRLDLQTVWKQLTTTRAERDEEVAARHAAEAAADEIRLDLERTHQELVRCRQDLEEERNHTVRSSGFSEVARKETVQQVLSDVRQGINHRLEDIRNYADREKPNREEILELVKEIEDHLSKLETRLQP